MAQMLQLTTPNHFYFNYLSILLALYISSTHAQISPGGGTSTVTFTLLTTSSVSPQTNPCTTGTDDCLMDYATCIPLSTSTYRCQCNDGFQGDGREAGNGCTDFNECSNSTTNLCEYKSNCINEAGTFRCTCPTGYTLDGLYNCQDNNECLQVPAVCSSNSICANTVGSYMCTCDNGFQKATDTDVCIDINECASPTTNDCISPATCQNTIGSYRCNCPTGYEKSSALTCQNINECLNSTLNICDINADCIDNAGSFQCTCKSGFTGNGVSCTDTNECGTSPCDVNADCTNTAGGYECKCKPGYAGDGNTCSDFNECTNPSDNQCESPATCVNNVGSYTCECPEGYTLFNAFQCRDINECTTGDVCGSNSQCENTIGSFNCICSTGYEKQGNNACIDINECDSPALNKCHDNAQCINTEGGYNCVCNAGYEGTGFQCTNVNECLTTNNCSAAATCQDTAGSYNCLCKPGHTGDGFVCTDINECLTSPCNQTCTNTPGSYLCSCQTGYTSIAPHDCQDINECSDSSLNDCHPNADCTNTIGSFTCTCRSGYLGDGKFCSVDNFVSYQDCNYFTNQDKNQLVYRMQSRAGIPFGSNLFSDIYVCANGFMSLGTDKCEDGSLGLGSNFRTSGYYVAPFWADVDLTLPAGNEGSTSNRVYYCDYGTAANSVLAVEAKNKVQDTVRKYSNNPSFTVDEVYLATWHEVAPYISSIYFPQNMLATFQAVIASDKTNTYVYFVYFDMLWNLFTPIQVGYRSSDATASVIPSVPAPYHYMRFDRAPGNTGENGLWLWQVSNTSVSIESQNCDKSSTSTIQPTELQAFYSSRNKTLQRRMDCPCAIQQAIYDGRYTAENEDLYTALKCNFNIEKQENCPVIDETLPFCIQRKNVWFADGLTDPSSGEPLVYVTRCCFDTSNGALIKTVSQTREPLTQNYFLPSTVRTPKSTIRQSAINAYKTPFSDCCLLSSKCDQYQERTVIPDCSSYKAPKRAPTFGDPHIVTLDGLPYTFNGLGDFYLLTSADIVIQSRTCNVNNSATVFCGYAMKETSTKVEAYIENGDFSILVNDTIQNLMTLRTSTTTSFSDVDITYEETSNRSTFIIDFTNSETSIAIEVFSTFLQAVVSYPPDGATTSGLLGVFNGDQSDDLTSKTGAILQPTASEESIYNNFGLTWKVLNDSLFTRPHSSLDDSFIPTFFTTLGDLFNNNSQSINQAASVCGNFSIKTKTCFFDYALTLDKSLAQDGLTFVNTAGDVTQLINKDPPAITSPFHLNVTYNVTSEFFIQAIPNTSSNLTYFLQNHTDAFVLLDNKTGHFSFTPQNVADKVTVGAVDENGLYGIFTPSITYCNCRNNGQCDHTQYEYEHANNTDVVIRWTQCICPFGYTGPFCEEVVDICEDNPCFADVICTIIQQGGQQNGNIGSTVQRGVDVVAQCGPCPTGYTGDGRKCSDIDDCSLSTNDCEQVCNNAIGSYSCSCNSGFTLNENNKTCDDINECNNATVCPEPTEKCTNTNSSYRCDCIEGYRRNSENVCTDVDECIENTDGCQHVCRNNNGSFSCECNSGFTLNADNLTCTDIDECARSFLHCHNDAICTNTIGGVRCDCLPGFEGNGTKCEDLNECNATVRILLGVPQCNATCQNTRGSYQCSCPVGFQLSLDGFSCLPMNPCLTENNGCDSNAVCEFKDGNKTCTCKDGFPGDGSNCTDVNECLSGVCTQGCNNSIGSYMCTCGVGFELDADGRTCNDINECVFGNNCVQNCTNTIGSFTCTCFPGYEKNGSSCQDINECNNVPSPCDQDCTNTPGSYVCSCRNGYELIDGACENQDECLLGTDNCHSNATCSDTIGSFGCSCKPGFSGNGVNCQDINECLDPATHGCRLGQTVLSNICQNTQGSFICVCPSGYTLHSDGKTCLDNDECLFGTDNCKKLTQRCSNTIGSFECIELCPGNCQQLCNNTNTGIKCYCQPGYVINPSQSNVCDDVNECLSSGTNNCHTTAECVNSAGSYSCRCPSGTTGNPIMGCKTATTPEFPNGYKIVSGSLKLYNTRMNGQNVNPTDNRLTDTTSQFYKDIVNYLKDILTPLFRSIESKTIDVVVVVLSPATTPGVQRRNTDADPIDMTYRVRFEEAASLNLDDLLSKLNSTLAANSYLWNSTDFSTFLIPSAVVLKDENECTSGVNECHAKALCTNSLFSYTCECNSNFKGDGFTCEDENDDTDLLVIVLPLVLGGLLLLIVIIVWILVERRRRRRTERSYSGDSVDGGSHVWEPFPGKMRARSMHLPSSSRMVVPTQYRDLMVDT